MRDFTQHWMGRSGKASYDGNGPAYPMTGLPPGASLDVQAVLNWTPGGVAMQGVTHRSDGDPVYYGTPTTRLYRAGRT